MSYYESVVLEYLRADRALFVNTEYCIQLETGRTPAKGSFWYCDVVTADFRSRTIFLCEISYAKNLAALVKRLRSWNINWDGVCGALKRDSKLPDGWNVRPWLFVPDKYLSILLDGLKMIDGIKFKPKITPLDMIQPWKYPYNRVDEADKPGVPLEMRT